MAFVDGSLVKDSNPPIYIIDGGQRRWIPTAETFELNGYNWGAVQTIPQAELLAIPQGPDILPFQKLFYPVAGDPTAREFQGLQYGRWMSANGGRSIFARCELDLDTGLINGQTVTVNAVQLDGFKGSTHVVCMNRDGYIIANGPYFEYGVNATGLGQAPVHRIDGWTMNVGAAAAGLTRQMVVALSPDPDGLKAIMNNSLGALFSSLTPAIQALGAWFAAKPQTASGSSGGTADKTGGTTIINN